MISLFQDLGKWYKGNLHTHTTRSDGRRTPEECMSLYQEQGYDFLALTDHWKPSQGGRYEQMLLLAGAEWDIGPVGSTSCVHLVGIGMKAAPALERGPGLTAQGMVDAIRAAGGEAILAHPAWSLTQPELACGLTGLLATEIYNSVSAFPYTGRPDSSEFVDQCAMRGCRLPCLASDDAHFYTGEQCRSYTMVNAKGNTREEILEALRQGNFYASQGPQVYAVRYDRQYVEIECSPCAIIGFMSSSPWAGDRVVQNSAGGRYEIKSADRYMRIHLIDKEGRQAWVSPFAIGDRQA